MQLTASRDFSVEGVVISFMGASSLLREPKSDVLVGLLETSGSFVPGKEIKIGEIRVLRLYVSVPFLHAYIYLTIFDW